MYMNAMKFGLGEEIDALRETVARFAAAQFPDLAWPHMVLGNLLAQHGDRPQAEAAFQRVLELEPDNLQARGALQRLQGEPTP